jgi:hypothetical protein
VKIFKNDVDKRRDVCYNVDAEKKRTKSKEETQTKILRRCRT